MNTENYKLWITKVKNTQIIDKLYHIHGVEELVQLTVYITWSNLQIHAVLVQIPVLPGHDDHVCKHPHSGN